MLEYDVGELYFPMQLLDDHYAALTGPDVAVLKAVDAQGDIDTLLQWYLNRPLLPIFKVIPYVTEKNVFVLGAWGSGKTTNVAEVAVAKCLMCSYFKFVNMAPVGRQAEIMFRWLRRMIRGNDKIEHLVTRIRERPYPFIEFYNGSLMEFLTAKPEYLDHLQGEEYDWANIDEAALLIDFPRVMGIVRPRLRGIRERIDIERTSLVTITTVPGSSEELKKRYDRGLKGDRDYFSLMALQEHNEKLSEDQLRLMMDDILPENIPTMIHCEWPSVTGRLIPMKHYDACQSIELMMQMDEMIENRVIGAMVEEDDRLGILRWEMPVDPSHSYVTVGDPGQGSPPKRGAGVVMVWDTTETPADLVYFDWVFGRGSISPWVAAYKYAKMKYTGACGFDTTSTQKYMDELVFEAEGILVHPLNFSRDKMGFLNALRFLLERRNMRFPMIQAMRLQCSKYDLPDDKLAQDIVACLMMSAWMIRPSMRTEKPEQEGLPNLYPPRGHRGTRQIVRRTRR